MIIYIYSTFDNKIKKKKLNKFKNKIDSKFRWKL